jgi:hypothetical protein
MDAHSHDESDRIDLCDGSPENKENQGQWLAERTPGHGIRTDDVRIKDLAGAQRLAVTG